MLVSQFCKTNNTSIEFFPFFVVVKDLITGAQFLRGANMNDIYEWPQHMGSTRRRPCALVGVAASHATWHHQLGHPSSKILHHVIQSQSLSTSSTFSKDFVCDSCSYNKSHKLPFDVSTLKSHKPLDLVYSDVWGPAPISSYDGFRYYVIFVDHFTKYIWLYPLKQK